MKNMQTKNEKNSQEKMVLQVVKKCPSCGADFAEKNVKLISRQEKNFLAHLTCASCQTGLMARVATMPFGLLGTATMTDLEADEAIKFSQMKPIDADDVLDFYKQYNRQNNKLNKQIKKD